MNKAAALLVALAAFARPCSALDLSAGGEVSSIYSIAYGQNSGGDYAWFSATPLAALSGPSWELRLSASFSGATDPAETAIELEEARIRVWMGDFVTLSAGYGQEDGTAAEVFPLTAFLGPSDPLSRLEFGETRRKSEASAALKVMGSWWRASLECAPFEPELVLPNLESPWFPNDLVPSSVWVGATEYVRSSLSYFGGTAPSSLFVFEPSYIAKAGSSLGPVDLDLEYFHGLERQATMSGIVDTTKSLGYSFDATLVPNRSIVNTFVLAMTVVAGKWRFWSEDSYTWGASYASGSVALNYGATPITYYYPDIPFPDNFTSIPPMVNVDKIGTTIGMSWSSEVGSLSVLAFLEATWTWFPAAPANAPVPSLSRAAAGSVSLSGLPGGMRLDVSGLLSLADFSAAILPSVSFDLGGERQLKAAVPLFLGSPGTELGSYSGKQFLQLGFSQKF